MGDTLSKPVTDKDTQTSSNDFLEVACSGMQGWRRGMEDAHAVVLSLDGVPGDAFFAVYDGHCGAAVAQHCGENLHRKILADENFKKKAFIKAIENGFMGTDQDLLRLIAEGSPGLKNDNSGCTAVTVLLVTDEAGKKQILCGNAGDSRAVLCRGGRAVALSEDHKPTNDKEVRRITEAGSFVSGGRVNGNLALSRAIGDFEFKQKADKAPADQAITAFPEVRQIEHSEHDEFIVVACDGIWDCVTNDDVVKIVRSQIKNGDELKTIIESLFDRILAPCAPGIGCDNMTMTIVKFKNSPSLAKYVESGPDDDCIMPDDGVTAVTVNDP